MIFIDWLKSEISKSEQSLFEVEGLIRRARAMGYLEALKDAKKEYERSNVDDGR